jgi:hypothetical protein
MLGPDNEVLTVGFVRIMELYAMFKEMGSRFFDRNIRGALPEDEVVNRSLTRAFRRIVLEGKDLPAVFPFNHNGVALSAELIEEDDGHLRIVEPRILNGVQTLITLERFLNASSDHDAFRQGSRKLEGVKVLCKVVTKAQPEFVTTVTVNNNRQNPVEPWNLRANDKIQLELQDKFRNQLGIYYERQEHAFSGLSEDDLGGLGIKELRAIQLLPLAKTFLVADGDIDKLQRLRQVFDDDYQYAQVFSPGRLRIDSRHILLCYKIQFRLRKLVNDIVEKGVNRYFYISRARNLVWALLCQGVLNDGDLEVRAQRFGSSLSRDQLSEWLSYPGHQPLQVPDPRRPGAKAVSGEGRRGQLQLPAHQRLLREVHGSGAQELEVGENEAEVAGLVAAERWAGGRRVPCSLPVGTPRVLPGLIMEDGALRVRANPCDERFSWLNRTVEHQHPLLERAQQAPEAPGVYQFQDGRGRVLYVGKAKQLRRRVLSYFSRQLEPRLAGMLGRAKQLEFVVTVTEVEALILENRLIKRHRPRYNVLLRDDKTYPYVKLTTGEAWPRAYLTRRILDDGHSYFGPYLGHGMASRVMDLIRTRTQVRTCTIEIDGTLPRPCLYHDMGACQGRAWPR